VSVAGGARVVLADGRVALLRELRPDDHAGVLGLHRQLERRDQYFRFFGPLPPGAAELVGEMTAPSSARHGAVGVFLDAAPLGVATYEALADPTVAEVALAVSGSAQAHGVGTLVLEHLVSLARRQGVRRFVAEVLTENARMLRMFRASGLPVQVTYDGSVTHVDLVLDQTEAYLDAMGERERSADAVNLRTLLRPGSVAVVDLGAPGSPGSAVLANLLAGGYLGRLYAIGPDLAEVPGVLPSRSVAALPVACDLAVLCGPSAAVPDLAHQCGARGVRALVVLAGGSADGPALRAAARRYGMRMVGPSTAAPCPSPAGSIGLVTQTGRIGIALRGRLGELGLGFSAMVSTGDKVDVSGNDMLMWWRRDESTTAVALCLESFGNPRKFGRLCQALARTKPVLALRTGSSSASREALFRQAGVIAVDTATELVGTLAALAGQPLPPGDRVAVRSHAGGLGAPGADAYAPAGLVPAELGEVTVSTLGALAGGHTGLTNPVSLPPTVDVGTVGRCLAALLADPGVDAVIVTDAVTGTGDPTAALPEIPRGAKPVLAVSPGQPAAVTMRWDAAGAVTVSYADPVEAVAVLGRLAGYARWRSRPEPPARQPTGVDVPRALEVLREILSAAPGGGWVDPSAALDLLGCFGIHSRRAEAPLAATPAVPGLRIALRCDGVFGPMVELDPAGANGVPAAGRTVRFTPLADSDIDALLSVRQRAGAAAATDAEPAPDAARGLLARLSLLAQVLPEVAELEVTLPGVTAGDGSPGARVCDARVRVARTSGPDPYLPALPCPGS
jgi:acyl-CoA synthetase (NDP forming)/GNAT superfamily N-acetyltransferase